MIEIVRQYPELKEVPLTEITKQEPEIRLLHEKRQECISCKKTGVALDECLYPLFDYSLCMLTVTFCKCKKRIYSDNLRQIERAIKSTKISEKFQNRRFETFAVNAKNKLAYEKCKKYCENFSEKSGQGLILIGGYGTGKTHLAVAILHELLEKSVSGLFITVPELLAEIRKSFDNKSDSGQLLNKLKTVQFLILDDLGAEKPTEWVKEQIFVIINSRYENMKSTVITSNCVITELENRIGPRTVSRIIEMCDGVLLDGEDYRKKKLGGAKQ